MHFNLVHFTPPIGLGPLYKNASKYHTIMQLKTQPNATQLHNWKRNQMQKRNMFAQLKTQHDYALENAFRKRKKYFVLSFEYPIMCWMVIRHRPELRSLTLTAKLKILPQAVATNQHTATFIYFIYSTF